MVSKLHYRHHDNGKKKPIIFGVKRNYGNDFK